ncbi:uncharacterized protein DUF4214, partial [Desulfobotulus alkaliphilus]
MELYVAIFGRAPRKSDMADWTAQSAGKTPSEVAGLMLEASPAAPAGDTTAEFLNSAYNAFFGRDADAEGLAYWLNELETGLITREVLVENLTWFASQGETVQHRLDYMKVQEQVTALQHGIETSAATYLTTGQDVLTGSSVAYDTFKAYIHNNANTFQSGDMIDGGAGKGEIYAEIGNSQNFAIAAKTVNIDKVTVRTQATNDDSSNNDVTPDVQIDAQEMRGVKEWWSTDNRASLHIEDVRHNSHETTIGWRNTDPGEVDYKVYFDPQHITGPGAVEAGGTLYLQLMDINSMQAGTGPLENNPYNGFTFTFNGERKTIQSDAIIAAKTYTELVAAINAQIAVLAQSDSSFAGLQARVGDTFTATHSGSGIRYEGNQVDIVNTGAGTLGTGGWLTPTGEAPGSGNIAQHQSIVPPVTPTTRTQVDIILDNVGRGSKAGDLLVGNMSEGSYSGSEGIQQFNVEVQKSSWLNKMSTTNGTLEVVMIKNAANHNGNLRIDDLDGGDWMALVNADALQGNLTLGTAATPVTNMINFQATGGGVVDLTAEITLPAVSAAGPQKFNYVTGSANDKVAIDLSGHSINTVGSEFNLNTGGGNDTVHIEMGAGASQKTMANLKNLKIDTGSGDDRINIDAYGNFHIKPGSGNDFVRINSMDANGDANYGTWNFGATSFGTTDNTNTFAYDNILHSTPGRVLYNAKLTVSFAGFESQVTVQTTAANGFIATQKEINAAIKQAIETDPVLKHLLKAEYTTGVGFNQELKVTSTIGGENNLAIDLYQPQLVAASPGAGQVALAANDFTAVRQGLINTTALTSDTLTDGNLIAAANGEYTNFYGSVGLDGDGNGTTVYNVAARDAAANQYQGFDAGTSTDSSWGVNFSTVNPTAGHDVVVFHSNEDAANVLQINQAFGKVNVVNFHKESPDQVDILDTTANVGLHAIDFKHYLNNQVDVSTSIPGNTQSAVPVNITLNNRHPAFADSTAGNADAAANSVSMLQYQAGGGAGAITWNQLTASNLVSALNGGAGAAVLGNGNIEAATLSPEVYGTTLVGLQQKHIVMVENAANPGEYKVFYLTSTLNASKTAITQVGGVNQFDTASAQMLGTLDFGTSINFGLAGNAGYDNTINALMTALDTGAPTYPTFSADGTPTGGTAPTPNKVAPPTVVMTVAEYNAADPKPAFYSIADDAADLAAAVAVMNDAHNITVTDTADATEAAAIIAATNAGTTTFAMNIEDSATALDAFALGTATVTGDVIAQPTDAQDITALNLDDVDIINVQDGESVTVTVAQAAKLELNASGAYNL